MPYETPKTIWSVAQSLHYNVPLPAGDARVVPTAEARGNFSFAPLLKRLGVVPKGGGIGEQTAGKSSPPRGPAEWRLEFLPHRVFCVFCGHTGCGKSTELRRLVKDLDHPDLFFVCFVDAKHELDTNNLEYPDLFMALAQQLFDKLKAAGISLDRKLLRALERWFEERIETNERTREFAADVKAGAKAGGGIPFLGKLFADLTNSFKVGSSYKEELRRVIKDSFSQFAKSFNALVAAAEAALSDRRLGRKILFVVDGTDRLSQEQSQQLFVGDVNQVQLLDGNFIYCAPILMLYESNQMHQAFHVYVLPMIKLEDQKTGRREPAGYAALRNLLLHRADAALFDSEETIETLIQYSGGNPRELLRLLDYAYQMTQTEKFDREAANRAVVALATDYRRFLSAADYQLLRAADQGREADAYSERIRFLLYNLALLEYNSYWRRSHPVIRTLEDYQRLQAAARARPHAKRKSAKRR